MGNLLSAAAPVRQQVAVFSPLVDAVSAGGNGYSPASVPKYSGLADGDVLLAFWAGFETTSTTWDVAWTLLDLHGSAAGAPDRSAKILWKVVSDAASEPATYEPSSVGSSSGAWGNTLTVVTLRGIDNTTPIDAFNTIEDDLDTATPVCPSLTTVTAGAYVFAFAMTSTNADPVYVSNDNGGALAAEEYRDAGTFDCSQVVVWFTQGTAGATGDTTFTYTNAGGGWDWATTHVAVRPA